MKTQRKNQIEMHFSAPGIRSGAGAVLLCGKRLIRAVGIGF